MERFWLGYNGLALAFADITAVLVYTTALDGRIKHAYGSVPSGVCTVVVSVDGEYWPSRWPIDAVRRRWADWRGRHGTAPPPVLQ